MNSPMNRSMDELLRQSDVDLEREVNTAMDGTSASELSSAAPGATPTDDELVPGSLVKGRVANVTAHDVLIDLGGKMLGVAPRQDFDSPPQVGDDVETVVEELAPRGGMLCLSRRKAGALVVWRDLHVGMVLEGRITGMNRGGLEMDCGGVRGFIPASQVDLQYHKDISDLIGQVIQAEVTKFDKLDQSIVLSRRRVLEREAAARREQIVSALVEGQTCRGKVRNVTDYGAFIELAPGVDGLLHVSDLSWGRVTRPTEVVQVGQELEVQVLKVNREAGKISLGLKQIKANPWERVAERYAEQQRVSGRVARLADFGAFVELEEGIDGLIPLSEMSWTRRVRHPKEIVKEGDVVEVVILAVDAERKRITLGLKQIAPNPWDGIAERYPVDCTFPARVARIAEFGAFVELEPGIDGLLHISEVCEQRIKSVTERLSVGQEVQVRVLRIDLENRRISLSMKAPPAAQPESAPSAPAKPKKPAKPRRGGLDVTWAGGTTLGALDPSKFAR